MFWSPDIKDKMRELVADTPPQYHKFLEAEIFKSSVEFQASKLGKSEIDEEALIRGYITAVPRHLRDGIEEVLSEHNYDLLYFRPVFDEPNFLNHNHHHQPPPPPA